MTSLIPELPLQQELTAEFTQVHEDAHFRLSFMRTLRIPDDGRDYPLPAGLGQFPMVPCGALGARLPRDWPADHGVALPMYQSEAMWLSFGSRTGYPFAIQVLAGTIDAVSGEDWAPGLRARPQNYLVVPDQPWLDGFCVSKGRIRQFVAEPLGQGRTVEEQLTGQGRTGGLQIEVVPMKAAQWEKIRQRREERVVASHAVFCVQEEVMGLAAGGTMIQEIYRDRHGLHVWEQDAAISCHVRIVPAQEWQRLTRHPMPHPPITQERYKAAGIPWFSHFDVDLDVVSGAERFEGMGGGGGLKGVWG